ncbi:MAG: GTP 3',8-cyclase MoaA, partial [Pirellulales bacterium]|nr:GTP 3',8-cyclase MoaA [Pirellulales bacterium]
GESILETVRSHFGPVTSLSRPHPAQPAEDFSLPGGGKIGIIRSVTAPFCSQCNRIRITADGSIRNCLFAQDEVPLRDMMRGEASDDQLLDQIRRCVMSKGAAHGINSDQFSPPQRPMYAIGG